MLLATLGLWWWGDLQDARDVPIEAGPLFPGLVVNDIDHLYLLLSQGGDLSMVREPLGSWRITEPGDEYAAQHRVATLLDTLSHAEGVPLDESSHTIHVEDVGLDPAKTMIRFTYHNRQHTLLLGAADDFGRYVYARRQGHPEIFLASRNLTTLLEGHGEQWVDPLLYRGLSGDVTRFRMERDDGWAVAIERQGRGWISSGEEGYLLDPERVQSFIRALRFVEKKRVISTRTAPADLHALGLPTTEEGIRGDLHGSTKVSVWAQGQDPAVVYLALGASWLEGTAVAAMREGSSKVLEVDPAAFGMLPRSVEDLREHRLFPPVVERARSLAMIREGVVLLDIRSDREGVWTFAAPANFAGELVETRRLEGRSPLRSLLGALDQLKAVGFCDPPTGDPTGRLLIAHDLGGVRRNDYLELYAPLSDGRIPAKSSWRESEGLLLPPSVWDHFQPFHAHRLRLLSPIEVNLQDWMELRIRVLGQTAPYVLKRTEDGWEGDDEAGRRVSLGFQVAQGGVRGTRWEPARPGAKYPYQITLLNGEGAVLADFRLRLPTPDEPQEVMGYPAAITKLGGYDDAELVVFADAWLPALDTLQVTPTRR